MLLIDDLRSVFLDYLQAQQLPTTPNELYEPNTYFLNIGGKRLRPILLLLANQLYKGNVNDALPAALAIEYFHNFTLIHDDVMDDAPLRRNQQTVHEKYNINTAILSGDVLLIKAYELLSKIDNEKLTLVFKIFNQTAIEVCEGQQYDINFETQTVVTEADYIYMITLKTSVLIAAAMQIGALLGNATTEDANLLYDYALNLGIAFQIQDDILDCYGDNKQVGKQIGGDIIQNKKTLLMIKALADSSIKDDSELSDILLSNTINNDDKINQVLTIFECYNIKAKVIKTRDSYIAKAKTNLAQLNLDNTNKAILESLIHHLVLRAY
ncbi:MAG: polyprenyl synthetase family protein [Chitinophagales bacterium]|nr:polyprenyl synthetase family protein [Chitinophagales bacterium]